jgi:hypothetical protein
MQCYAASLLPMLTKHLNETYWRITTLLVWQGSGMDAVMCSAVMQARNGNQTAGMMSVLK